MEKLKKPLVGATVKVEGKIVTTNSKGQVVISNLKPGKVDVTGSDEGYYPKTVPTTIINGKTEKVVVSLEPEVKPNVKPMVKSEVNKENGSSSFENSKVTTNSEVSSSEGKTSEIKAKANPKTGDVSELPFLLGAIVAGFALVANKFKKNPKKEK